MIAALREWLTSIVAVTLLISLTEHLIPKGTVHKVASFIGGLLLITAMLRPLLRIDLSSLEQSWTDYGTAIEVQRQELEEDGAALIAAEVERSLSVCIQEKAQETGTTVTADVRVEITPDGTPVPQTAYLEGTYQEPLSTWIELELGISKEQQVWTMAS